MRDLPKKIGSKYKFITVSAKRCEMLQKGAKPKVETDNMTKFTTVAMEEVLDDLISFRMIEDKDDDSPVEEVILASAEDEVVIASTDEKVADSPSDEEEKEGSGKKGEDSSE